MRPQQFKEIHDPKIVEALAKDRAPIWLAVLERDGYVLVDRYGRLADRFEAGDFEPDVELDLCEAAASKGLLFKGSRSIENNWVLNSREWEFWRTLSGEESRRLFRMNSAAIDAQKPTFPGWSLDIVPEDFWDICMFEYDGQIQEGLRDWLGRTYKGVPEMPEDLYQTLSKKFDEVSFAQMGMVTALNEAVRPVQELNAAAMEREIENGDL